MASHVNTGVLRLIGSHAPDRLWHTEQPAPTVGDVSTRQQDTDFAHRLGPMLLNLRREVGWTREDAEEELGIPASTLGKWERGQHPPKAADLSRLFLGYIAAGVPADPRWFLDPPAVVTVDPVRSRLVELRAAAEAAVDLEEGAIVRKDVDGRAAPRGTRSA